MTVRMFAPFAALVLISSCRNFHKSGQEANNSRLTQADRDQLRSLASDERVRQFYQHRDWTTVWSASQEAELISRLTQAHRHALDTAGLLQEIEKSTGLRREIALTKAALKFAHALAVGQVDPRQIFKIYTIPGPRFDAVSVLGAALERNAVGEWLDSLPPGDPDYRALSEAYLHYRNRASQGPAPIPDGPLIRAGDVDPRIPAIRSALRSFGYMAPELPANDPRQPDIFTPEIAEAVRNLQLTHRLSIDGVLGRETLSVLNSGPVERARQLAVNLERRRWLERNPAGTRIDVNTASAQLDYWHDGSLAAQRRVVVGQPGWKTPQLGAPIFRLVANPTWTVPKSIERAEIAPKGEGYLRRNNMVRRNGWIVQLSGPENALGQVKFDMRSDYAIYLHDTPAQHLFQREQRQFSHGCVRVQQALAFARTLAERDGKLDEFERALASGDEAAVRLDREIPVRLVYHTVFSARDGRLAFRPDSYGWDDDVAKALGLGEGRRSKPSAYTGDVGP